MVGIFVWLLLLVNRFLIACTMFKFKINIEISFFFHSPRIDKDRFRLIVVVGFFWLVNIFQCSNNHDLRLVQDLTDVLV